MKIVTWYDLKGQYCNRNCVSCSAFSLATAGLSYSFLLPIIY